MIINYNSLSSGRDTWLKNGEGDLTGSPPSSASKTLKWSWLASMLLLLLSFIGNAQVIVPASNANNAVSTNPYGTYFGYQGTDVIYLASEIGSTGSITGIGFYLESSSTPAAVPVVIQMRTTTATTVPTSSRAYATLSSGVATVYSGTIPASSFSSSGWVNVTFPTPFTYSGNNLEIFIKTSGGGSGTEGSTGKQFRWSTATGRCITWGRDSNATLRDSDATNQSFIPNIQLLGLTPPTCLAPSALSGTATGLNSANLAWTASSSSPSSGYEWEIRTSGSPGTAGAIATGTTGAGVVTATTSALSASTTYTLYVRSNCGGGDFSSWASSSTFTTPTPMALGTVAVVQGPTTQLIKGDTNKEILRIALPTTNSGGSIALSGLTVTSANISDADIASGGVKLYYTTSTTFSTSTPVGSGVSFSGGTATFTGLTKALATGNNYIWVTYDIASTATIGNTVDASLAIGAITFTTTGGATAPGTTPAAAANPTGNRAIGYCVTTPGTVNTGDTIVNVTLGAINNTTTSNGSTNFDTYPNVGPAVLQQTVPQNLSIKFGTDSTQWSAVWIDYNQNGIFEASENVALATSAAGGSATVTYSITVPETALLGTTWMRVRGGSDSTYAANGACTASSYGETEDYKVTIQAAPSCTPPTALTVSALTSSGATLSWTAASSLPSGGYEWEIRTSGTPGTAGAIATGSTAAGVLTDSTSALSPITTYTLYVRSNCGSSTFSAWASSTTFTTPCAAISSFPWTENFDAMSTLGAGVFPSACWKTTGSNLFTTQNAASQEYNDPRSTPNYVTVYYPSSTPSYLWLPAVQLTAGQSYDFSFYWAGDGFASWTGDILVNTVQSETSATALTPSFVAAATTTASTYTKATRSFIPSVSGIYYFGIKTSVSTSAPYYMGFDDFKIELSPSCIEPGSLAGTPTTAAAANLSWAASTTGASLGYEWEVRSSGTPGTAGAIDSGTTPSGTLTASTSALAANTTYTLYVRGKCGTTDYSSWAASAPFTTPCTGASLATPVVETFDVSTATPACWSKTSGWVIASYTPGFDIEDQAYSSPNLVGKYYGDTTDAYLYSLPIDMTTAPNGATISMRLVRWASGSPLDSYVIMVNTSASPIGAQTLATVSCKNDTATSSWVEFIQDIPASFNSATILYVIVKGVTGSGSGYDMAIDNFQVKAIPSCYPPIATYASNIGLTTATVNWVAGSPAPTGGYQWEIRSSGAPGSGGAVASGSVAAGVLSDNATGLANSSTYTLYARANCDASGYSEWIPSTFATLCPTASIPYTEDFSTAIVPNLPACVSNENVGSGNNWVTLNEEIGDPAFPASQGNYLAYIYNEDFAANTWFYTRALNLTQGVNYKISYKYSNDGGTTYAERLKVAYGTSAASTAMTNAIATHSSVTGGIHTNTVTFSPPATGVYYFGFNAYSQADKDILQVDDIVIDFVPPVITSFTPTEMCAGTSGTEVTITGTDLLNVSSVTFNGVAGTIVPGSNTATSVKAIVPSSATSGTVTVVTDHGTASGSSFVVNAYPVVNDVTSASPTNSVCIGETLELFGSASTTWTSSDETKATVVVNGAGATVTPHAPGPVTIYSSKSTATTPACTTTKSITITVKENAVINSSSGDITVAVNTPAVFTANATAVGVTYQWQVATMDEEGNLSSWTDITAADAPTYTISNGGATLTLNSATVAYQNVQHLYQCVITGTYTCGPVTTNAAFLTVADTGISSQSDDANVCDSGSASFSVTASGVITGYQWQEDAGGDDWHDLTDNGSTITGATTDTLNLSGLTLADNNRRFRCIVFGSDDYSLPSAPRRLYVNESITGIVSPTTQSPVCYSGGSVTYTASASGTYTSIDWQYYNTATSTWNNVQNAVPTGASYDTSVPGQLTINTTAALSASGSYQYRANFVAPAGCTSMTSSPVTMTVNNPIVTSPVSTSVLIPNTATFSVTTGSVSPTYQWSFSTTAGGTYTPISNGVSGTLTYAGADTATLSVTPSGSTPVTDATHMYFYKVTVTSGTCSATSSAGAQMTVTNYCTSALTTTGNNARGITNVVITNTATSTNLTQSSTVLTSSPWYTFYSSSSLNIRRGQGGSVTMTLGTNGNQNSAAWIDFNNNGVFDASENIGLSASGSGGPVTYNFSIPSTAPLGLMRVRLRAGNGAAVYTAAGACLTYAAGETEDYLLNIQEALPPTITSLGSTEGCTGTNITINGTNLGGVAAADVTIGGTPVTSIVSNNGSVLVAVIGAGTSGAVSVNGAGGTVTGPNFTVNELPAVVTITGGGTICTSSTTLVASNGGSGTIYYQGTTSNGTSTTTASTSQTVSTAGTYYFRARSAAGCWGPQGSVTVTFNTPPVSPTTTNYSVCLNGTIPSGQGLASTVVGGATTTGSQTINFNVTGQPVETNAAPGNVVASATMSPLPTGAVVTSVTITYNNITSLSGSWRSDVRLGLSGAIVNTAAAGTGAADSAGNFNYTRNATSGNTVTNSGGTVNLLYWDNANDNGGAEATFPTGAAAASVVVNYTYPDPAAVSWYTASTGGTAIGTGTPFNPVGVPGSGVADTSAPGTYTFYAAVSNGTCPSQVRTAATLTIGVPLSVSVSQSTPTTTICQGTEVTLTPTVTGGGAVAQYSWKVDGNEVGTASTLVVTPAATTTYALEVTDICGAKANTSITINVNPTPTVTAPSAQTYCAGNTAASIPLTGTPSGVTFAISGGAAVGLANATGLTAIPSFTAVAGTATVTITPSANGCTGTPVTYDITVGSLPAVVTVTPASATVCAINGTPVQLTVSGNSTSVNYTQSFNGSTSMPAGWGTTVGSGDVISVVTSTKAGGTGNEAKITGNSQTNNIVDNLYYGPINTSGMSTITLQWNSWVDWYSSDYPFGVKIQTSTDHVNWHNTTWVTSPVTADIGPGLQTLAINTADVGSSTLYISFTMDGRTFGANAWYIDNVSITGSVSNAVTWSPVEGLYTNAEGTIPYVANTSATTVYAKPLSTQVYAATAVSSLGCPGPAKNVTVSVNQGPTASVPATQTFCSGSLTTPIALESVAGRTYNITGGSSIGLTDALGVTAIPAFTAGAPGSAVISVSAIQDGCTGPAVTFTINISQPTVGGSVSGSAIPTCTGSNSGQLTLSGHTGDVVRWESSVAPFTVWTPIANTLATYTSGALAQTTQFRAVVKSGACSEVASEPFTVIINAVTLSSISSPQVCLNAETTITMNGLVPNSTSTVTFSRGGVTQPTVVVTADASGVGSFNVLVTGPSQNITVQSILRTDSTPNCTFTPSSGNSTTLVVSTGCTGLSVCGWVMSTIDQTLIADNVSATQAYRWRVTRLESDGVTPTSEVQTLDSALRTMKLVQLAQYRFNTTYRIEVATLRSGVWGPFGAPCTALTPATTTTLASCGTSASPAVITTISDVVYANLVPYAAGYRFKITDATNSSITQTLDRPVREFRMNLITGFTVQYNRNYNVEVAVKNTDGTYLPYQPVACVIRTPQFPTTSVQDSQCDDYLVPGMTTQIYANSYPGAIAYAFQLTGPTLAGGPDYPAGIEVVKSTRAFNVADFPGLIPGATYVVKVRLIFNMTDPAGPYGKGCSIVAPGTSRQVAEEVKFNAVAYPNPFADNFNINVTTSAEENVIVKVYDMTGRLLETHNVHVADMETLKVGDRFPSGVYNVIVSQGENVRTLRVVKR